MKLNHLSITDYVLLALSMILCALIGFYFRNKNKSIDSYMLGDRKLSVIPVAISLMTSCMSGLSLLGSSAELYYQGSSYSFVALAMILSGPLIAFTILPVFYRMNELSLYKYLQLRYGQSIKYIVSIIFIFQMIFYNSVVLYLPSMCLQAVIGIDKFYSILLIGIMCVIYSGIGGLKAVVWTDFFQAMLMYLSIVIVGILGTYDAGGIKNVFEIAKEGQRLDLNEFLNFDLTTRHTIWGILFGSTIKHVYLVGVNQVQMQRGLSLSTLKQSQLCFIICSFLVALISLLSTYMGLVLYASYKGCDPYLNNEIPRRDAIIVHYVARRLSKIVGLRGIFVAGVFSATLSTLSSFSNSMAALAIEDYIKPIRKYYNLNELNESKTTFLAKILATLFGLICVLMAYVIDKANSRLLQATTTMFGAVGVPFLACFALGIYTRFTNTKGIIASLLVTITIGVYITIYQTFFLPPLEPKMPVYFNEQCEIAFKNMTLKTTNNFSNLIPPIEEVLTPDYLDMLKWPQVEPPFSLSKISYMTLPIIQFILTILIAIIVSLLTGGFNQEINENYLSFILHKKKTTTPPIVASSQDFFTNNFLDQQQLQNNSLLINANFLKNSENRIINKLPPANIDNFREQLSENIDLTKHKDKFDSPASDRKRKFGVVNRGFDSNSLTGNCDFQNCK